MPTGSPTTVSWASVTLSKTHTGWQPLNHALGPTAASRLVDPSLRHSHGRLTAALAAFTISDVVHPQGLPGASAVRPALTATLATVEV
jgi:hypothetical protein